MTVDSSGEDPLDEGIPLHALADGSLTRVVHHGIPILLARVGGDVHAVADTCSHEDVSLSLGSLCGYRLRCPLHGSEFDVRTGAALSAPAETPLQTWPVETDGRRVWLHGDARAGEDRRARGGAGNDCAGEGFLESEPPEGRRAEDAQPGGSRLKDDER